MTGAYERLLAEEIPTRPPPASGVRRASQHRLARRRTRRSAWTPEEQAEHRRVLLAALDAHDADLRAARTRRHLTAVPDPAAA